MSTCVKNSFNAQYDAESCLKVHHMEKYSAETRLGSNVEHHVHIVYSVIFVIQLTKRSIVFTLYP